MDPSKASKDPARDTQRDALVKAGLNRHSMVKRAEEDDPARAAAVERILERLAEMQSRKKN